MPRRPLRILPPGPWLRAGRAGLAARLTVALMLGPALHGCAQPGPQVPTQADAVRNAARSLGIVRSATAEHPAVLKVLFYGQSISKPQWTDQALAQLRRRYPHVTFDARNLALGRLAGPDAGAGGRAGRDRLLPRPDRFPCLRRSSRL